MCKIPLWDIRVSWLTIAALSACGGATVEHSNLTDSQAAEQRTACTFAAGTLPAATLAKSAKLQGEIPIDHIVMLMMENRSFDHLFSRLPAYGQPDVDVAPTDMMLPDGHGGQFQRQHLSEMCFDDTNHGWGGSHTEWNAGKNDGFVIANSGAPNDPTGQRAIGYYDETDLPYYYAIASQFSIADHYFCSLLGPTIPNRLFFYAGTSFGLTYTQLVTEQQPSIMDTLTNNKVSWMVYHETNPGLFSLVTSAVGYYNDHFSPLGGFFDDAKAGKLPSVVYIDPDLTDLKGGLKNDAHPPGDMQVAEQFISQVVEAIIASPNWSSTALFILYDEHGGLYDHVSPPAACPPDDTAPIIDPDPDPTDADKEQYKDAKFDRLGIRVPMVVVSPYARPHYVSHEAYDHTSVLRFIEARFNLPALTRRDANANPLYDLFDFGKAALQKPAARPPQVVDADKAAFCLARYPAQK